jgi:YidC/Oxa1 family membrane protein insertase
VALLVLLLLAWGFHTRVFSPPPRPVAPGQLDGGATNAPGTNASPVALPADTALRAPSVPTVEPVPSVGAGEPEPLTPSRSVVLSNDVVRLVFSSRSGGIAAAQLKQFRSALDKSSPPVELDFGDRHALSFENLPGMPPARGDYQIERSEQGDAVLVQRQTADGLRLDRSVAFADGYRLKVTDKLCNKGTQPLRIPSHGWSVGPMEVADPEIKARDSMFLGLDSLSAHGGEGVVYWLQRGYFGGTPDLAKLFSKDKDNPPPSVVQQSPNPVVWVAAKSKFFVQILDVGENTAGCTLHAWRDLATSNNVVIDKVAIAAVFPEQTLEPGATITREASYYVGPKKYALLKKLGPYQAEVMEFGRWFGWICKLLLPVLNGIYAVLPNYGVAIILLTVLVRIVFWPVTRKSTESMKKMQEIQPLVNQVRAKYKDKPQKQQQEIMALYKAHKVNPMAGCLPMLVQIPVFIALFTVLQSAVELRFASFLWIKDLSEPEGLLKEYMKSWPLVHSINLLPLIMTAMTIWQQKITPSTADPQQQKIMALMPVFFLFLFYSMASALVLYWTVSQLLAIVQLIQQQREAKPVAATARA